MIIMSIIIKLYNITDCKVNWGSIIKWFQVEPRIELINERYKIVAKKCETIFYSLNKFFFASFRFIQLLAKNGWKDDGWRNDEKLSHFVGWKVSSGRRFSLAKNVKSFEQNFSWKFWRVFLLALSFELWVKTICNQVCFLAESIWEMNNYYHVKW